MWQNVPRLSLTLLSVILFLSLSACSTGTMPSKPPRPNLDVIERDQGGICLDRQDTGELLHYIRDLERGYK